MSGTRQRSTISRDILDVAREQLPGADPCAVFDRLFDAAMRSLRGVDPTYPRRVEALNVALDRIYDELVQPSVSGLPAPIPLRAEVRRGKRPRPVLKP